MVQLLTHTLCALCVRGEGGGTGGEGGGGEGGGGGGGGGEGGEEPSASGMDASACRVASLIARMLEQRGGQFGARCGLTVAHSCKCHWEQPCNIL